jgi:hypothetical protein
MSPDGIMTRTGLNGTLDRFDRSVTHALISFTNLSNCGAPSLCGTEYLSSDLEKSVEKDDKSPK